MVSQISKSDVILKLLINLKSTLYAVSQRRISSQLRIKPLKNSDSSLKYFLPKGILKELEVVTSGSSDTFQQTRTCGWRYHVKDFSAQLG